MLVKLVGLIVLLGLLTNIVMLTTPQPVQVSWYNPEISDFAPGEQVICFAVDYPRQSKLKFGLPIRHVITVDYDDCSTPDRFDTAKSIFIKSSGVWQFYANWLVWSVAWLGLILVVRKLREHSSHNF